MKKGVGSGVGSGAGSRDPDPHQNVTDPQHWCIRLEKNRRGEEILVQTLLNPPNCG